MRERLTPSRFNSEADRTSGLEVSQEAGGQMLQTTFCKISKPAAKGRLHESEYDRDQFRMTNGIRADPSLN